MVNTMVYIYDWEDCHLEDQFVHTVDSAAVVVYERRYPQIRMNVTLSASAHY